MGSRCFLAHNKAPMRLQTPKIKTKSNETLQHWHHNKIIQVFKVSRKALTPKPSSKSKWKGNGKSCWASIAVFNECSNRSSKKRQRNRDVFVEIAGERRTQLREAVRREAQHLTPERARKANLQEQLSLA